MRFELANTSRKYPARGRNARGSDWTQPANETAGQRAFSAWAAGHEIGPDHALKVERRANVARTTESSPVREPAPGSCGTSAELLRVITRSAFYPERQAASSAAAWCSRTAAGGPVATGLGSPSLGDSVLAPSVHPHGSRLHHSRGEVHSEVEGRSTEVIVTASAGWRRH